jgi:hypothetical protein
LMSTAPVVAQAPVRVEGRIVETGTEFDDL